MLVGYVSDEKYVAINDVSIEFEREGQSVAVVRSTPRGAVYADIELGLYRVTLVRAGFGSKVINMVADPNEPYQFRLLADGLLGYAWPKWVKSGELSEFRCHSVEGYRLSLWRYGIKKEFVKLLGWFDEHGPRAVMQITPDGDYSQTGVNWNKTGYGSPHLTQFAKGPEKSGLYYFHAETESGAFFSFPWIVAPAKPSAPIAVLGANMTWNAYNNFGGRSNYINANELPPTPTVNARQDLIRYTKIGVYNVWGFPDDAYKPLSFERPEPGNVVPRGNEATDPIRGRLGSSNCPAEWRLLAWLEREGFEYDFYAESQLHDGTLDLDAYKVLMISVHPEYWTRVMYLKVKDWVHKRGGRLMYLGGNGLNCEVEILPSGAMHFKTMNLGVGGDLGMVDPNDPTKRYESRMHRTLESEAELLGVATTDTGIMTAAPYKVLDETHWAFAGTGLKNGDLFGLTSQHERCAGGASGHETDKMNQYSPKGTRLLAKGLNPDNGGGEITCYELENGGAVFSVGSIIYPTSLLVDQPISRVTANVLAQFLR